MRELRLPEVNKPDMIEPMAARVGRIAELVWSHPVLLQTSSLQRDSQGKMWDSVRKSAILSACGYHYSTKNTLN